MSTDSLRASFPRAACHLHASASQSRHHCTCPMEKARLTWSSLSNEGEPKPRAPFPTRVTEPSDQDQRRHLCDPTLKMWSKCL